MNSNIERKWNEVLKAVGNISERIKKLDEKLKNFDRCITKLEYLVEEKIFKFQQELKTKADNSALNELHFKIRKIQQQVDQLAKDVLQESYEKQFKILINGIEETDTSVWEKPETTLQLVRGLQIKDPSAIMLADYNRLPVKLNRLRTGVGRFHSSMHKWSLAPSPNCECSASEQTAVHVLTACPIHWAPQHLIQAVQQSGVVKG